MDKAPEAFRTISEVADELDLPQHVLRFWETRFGQIKPMKRGGGRRYYRPDDVDLLRGIRHLLYGEGYTIRGVQRILKDNGAKFVQSVWQAGAPQPRKLAADLEDSEAAEGDDGAEAPSRARGAGAAAPARRPAESAAKGQSKPAAGPRPAAPQGVSQQAAGAPAAAPSGAMAAGQVSTRLSQESIRWLEEVFHELNECRRLIDSILSDRS